MNTRDELRGELKRYAGIVTKPSKIAGKDMYECPLCGSGTHGGYKSDGALHVSDDTWYCHSCQRGGDIFTLYALIHNLDTVTDFPKIVAGLEKELGIVRVNVAEEKRGMVKENVYEEKKEPVLSQERMTKIDEFASRMSGSPAEQYLRNRGLTDEIIKQYRLGYDSANGAVVIPYPGTDYYTERIISPAEGQKRYDNLPGDAPTFMVTGNDTSEFYITEGQIDALSILQSGAENVIASHYPNKIGKLLETMRICGAVIVADRDETDPVTGRNPGRDMAARISEVLKEQKVESVVVFPPEGYKDANDLLRLDPGKLELLLEEGRKKLNAALNREKMKDCTVSEYLENQYDDDIAYFKKYKDRKVGFSNIDKYLTLYPGLACLTGATSLGKTTFCVQMADQLMQKGEYILMFPLEQPRIEIVTKSLARRMYRRDPFSPITNIDIKNGASSEALVEAREEYRQVGSRCRIIDSNFMTTADSIIDYIEKFIKKTGIKPIVIIDYLQIVAPPVDKNYTERERIDDAVKKFKLLSRRHELFILMVSNMARSSYKERIAEDSFKESGLIEYTCDYLFGLQLSILEDEKFFSKDGSRGGTKETLKSEKQDLIDQASAQIPKEIVFKSCKNRNGKKVFRAFFKYYPQYDCFMEDNNSKYEKKQIAVTGTRPKI